MELDWEVREYIYGKDKSFLKYELIVVVFS